MSFKYEAASLQQHISVKWLFLDWLDADMKWHAIVTSTLEATQGRRDGFFSQLPFECYLPEEDLPLYHRDN